MLRNLMSLSTEHEQFIATLEAEREESVRSKFAQHAYGVPSDTSSWRVSAVKAWLAEKDRAAETLLESARSARDEAMLRTAREANKLAEDANSIAVKARSDARCANIIAISAMVLSIATAIIVAVIQFISQKLPS